MLVKTRDFGEIEVQEDEIYRFAGGIPGFEQLTRFVMLQTGEGGTFFYLQSVEDETLSFVLTDPFFFFPDYEVEVTEALKEELEIGDRAEVVVLAVVSVRDRIAEATVNLLAPVIFNKSKRCGKQTILAGSGYTTKHRLMPANPVAAQAAASSEGE